MAVIENPVAVVTGSSRGVGKGVAVALGMKGATVYVTGRSVAAGDSWLPGTVGETAEAITAAGGRGIAAVCDHADDEAVKQLFDRIVLEQGRLDILVNNVSSLHRAIASPQPFWEKPVELAELIDVGLRSHYVASHHAARIMVAQGHGLIVGISFYGAVSYFAGPAYGAQKAGLDKMLFDMAQELRPHGVAALSIWLGFVATDRVLARRADAKTPTDSFRERLESPEFTGLVLDAVYRDPHYMWLSGTTVIGAELARDYGITDRNGKQPPSCRDTMGKPAEFFVKPG